MRELGPTPPEWMRVLVARRPRFLASLRSKVGADQAEDILQEALTRAASLRASLREESDERAVVAWFQRVLRSVLVDRARRQQVAARALARLPSGEPTSIDDAPRRPCACVERALETLSVDHRQVLRAVVLDERSVAHVAGSLGITSNVASVRLHRARAALEREVRRRCARCAVEGCLDCTCTASTG